MATPISKKPITILDPIFLPNALPPGDTNNKWPTPFSRFKPPFNLGFDFYVNFDPLMDEDDRIFVFFDYVMNPNGTPVSGQPTIKYPAPIPPSKTSPGLKIDPPFPTFFHIPSGGPLNIDPGYAVRYFVHNTVTGQTWGYGQSRYFFIL
jgi:hypothetical protein